MQITYNLLCYFYRKKNKVIFHRNVTGTETEMRLKALLNFELNKVSKNMISLPPLLFWSKFQSIWPLCFLICGLQEWLCPRCIEDRYFFFVVFYFILFDTSGFEGELSSTAFYFHFSAIILMWYISLSFWRMLWHMESKNSVYFYEAQNT